MRLVQRQEFLALPPNTVFAKFVPNVVSDLCIKGKSLENDFFYENFDWIECDDFGQAIGLFEAMKKDPKLSVPIEKCCSRDGLFDSDESMFLIYEKDDIKFIIERLTTCLQLGE